jgi:antitoxin component of RelBE/YafQ-DinJ toxin-antitoxin module
MNTKNTTKTAVSFKIDKDVRDRARKAAASLRIPLSLVVNQKLREFADARAVEFRESLVPNAKTTKEIRRVETDIRAGRNSSPAFASGEEMDAYLDALK